MVDKEAIIWLYRCMFGREPESDQVVDWMAAQFNTRQDAARGFFASKEFQEKNELYFYLSENNCAPIPDALKNRLALAAIMKNEEENIVTMLKSVSPIVGFVSLLDTGSSDKTIKVAKDYLDSVKMEYLICKDPFEDFTRSRNFALDGVPENFSWILMLDSDEYIMPDDYWRFNALLDSRLDGWALPRLNFTNAEKTAAVHPYPDRQKRLFRNRPLNKVRFSGKVHEQPTGVEEWGLAPAMSLRPGGQHGGPHIHHTGQLVSKQRFLEKDSLYRQLASRK